MEYIFIGKKNITQRNRKGCFGDHFQALLAVGSRILISPSCLYLALGTQKNVDSVKKPISNLILEKNNFLFSDLMIKMLLSLHQMSTKASLTIKA